MKYILPALMVCLLSVSAASAEQNPPAVIKGGGAVEQPDAVFKTHAEGTSLELRKGDLVLSNPAVRVVLRKAERGYRPEFHAVDAQGQWQLVARTARAGEVIPTSWAYGGLPAPAAYATAEVARNDTDGVSIRLASPGDRHSLVTTISLDAAASFVYVSVTGTIAGRLPVEQLITSIVFTPGNSATMIGLPDKSFAPDFTWAPRLRERPEDVIGDNAFGTPAVIAQKGPFLAALVPDAALLADNRLMPAAMNLDCSRGNAWMSYGFMKYDLRDSFAHHTGAMFEELTDATLRYGFHLLLNARSAPRTAYREVADFLRMSGRRPSAADRAGVQRQPISDWRTEVWPAEAAATADRTELHFTVARQDLRSAYGLARHARRINHQQMLAGAVSVLDTALAAPVNAGAFPVVCRRAADGALQWISSVGGPPNTYATSDCSNTARWLLRWHRAFARGRKDLVKRAAAWGDVLLQAQLPSGAIPAWLSAADLAPVKDAFYDSGADCAESAAFLAELHTATGDKRYAEGAAKILQYVQRKVLPAGVWADRSTGSARFDPLTGQHPHSSASIIAAIDACNTLNAATGDAAHLRLARQMADYLALFQNSTASDLCPATYGAVASRNIGAAWQCVTQADAAKAYADLYYLSDDLTCLDRAVDALRAGFGMLTPEQPPADAAAMLATTDELHDFWGNAMINVAGGWGRGLGAAFVNNLEITERTVRFDLAAPVPHTAPLTVRFWQCPTGREVIVNGESLGIFTPAQLWQGVQCWPRRPLAMEVKPLARSLAGVPARISAELTGGGRNADVRVVCRRNGGEFTEVAMKTNDGAAFAAMLPYELISQPGTVEYYVTVASGCESAVEPANAPAGGTFHLNVVPELVITCGRLDERYMDKTPATVPEAIGLGRLLRPSSPCVYLLPVPRGARALRLEITREGRCNLFVGDTLVEPDAADAPDGPTCVYTLTDPTMWPRQRLRLSFQVPDATAAILREIKLIPQAGANAE